MRAFETSDCVARLEERIRRLKADSVARKSWFEARREIERRGGKWRAENGMVVELREGAIYPYLSDHKEGVSNLTITALDAPVPYGAELHMDLQGSPPGKRKALLEELERSVGKLSGPEPDSEIVVIVKRDWLSKLSLARWGATDWARHLKATQMTLDSRRVRGKRFDPDLIYPGDTFEVKA